MFAGEFEGGHFFFHGVPDVLETLGAVVATASRMSVCNRSGHLVLPFVKEKWQRSIMGHPDAKINCNLVFLLCDYSHAGTVIQVNSGNP